jgi:3-hydroxy acid dehydrogenase / malonic semialdehyde reductase
VKPESQWAQGRVAFVTGATSGFGHALARRLLDAGARVIACGRRMDRLTAFATDASSDQLLIRQLDVRSIQSLQQCLASLPSDFEPIDILFNNAGLALGLAKAHEASADDWEDMIATNVIGLSRVTHAILPGMVARNRGDIVNMSSVAATYPYPGANVYGATKAYVRQFSLNLRADLLGTRVRVAAIDPGLCETEFSLVRFKRGCPGCQEGLRRHATSIERGYCRCYRSAAAFPRSFERKLNRVDAAPAGIRAPRGLSSCSMNAIDTPRPSNVRKSERPRAACR